MTTSTSSTTSTSYSVGTTSTGAASISGLASGIDTTSLISSLMAVEATTQTNLKTKLTTNQSVTSVLQAINTKLAALTTSAGTFSTGTALAAATVTGSVTTGAPVTATVTGTPALGTLNVSSTTLGTAQSAEFYGAGTSSWTAPSSSGTYSMTLVANGATTTITPNSYSAADVASAINSSAAGVSASVLTDTSGASHLILTAATGDFTAASTVTPSISAALQGFNLSFATSSGTTTNDAASASGTRAITAGADASITVAGITKTQHSNTFADIVSGLSVTVASTSSTADTLTIAQDTSTIKASVTSLGTALADVLKDITLALTSPASGTTASATNGGLLAGNSILRGVQQALIGVARDVSASTLPTGDTTNTSAIEFNSDGTVSVNADQLSTFLTQNATAAAKIFTNFGTALAAVTSAASTPSLGTVSTMITDNQSTATSLTDEISAWDTRLALRKSTLTAQYTAMETALSNLQNQSNALTQALKSINGTTDD